jgi:hypothetical protein
LPKGNGNEAVCVKLCRKALENGEKFFFKNAQKQRDKPGKPCVFYNFPVPLAGGTRVGQMGQGKWIVDDGK